jgi:VWFA-related protein
MPGRAILSEAARRSLRSRAVGSVGDRIAVAAACLLVLLLQVPASLPVHGQSPPAGAELTVAVGPGEGRAGPVDLAGARVFVDDVQLESFEEVAAGWSGAGRSVLYLDLASSRVGSIQRLASALGDRGQELVGLGDFEIVEANPAPRSLPKAAGSDELEQTLNRLFLRSGEGHEVAALRAQFLDELRRSPAEAVDLARGAHRLEVEVRRRQLDTLIAWVAAQQSPRGPHLLVLANDDLGLDGRGFYEGALPEDLRATAGGQGWAREPDASDVAEVLASYGWALLLLAEEVGDEGRLRYQPSEDLPVGFRFALGGRDQEAESDEVDLSWQTGSRSALEEAVRVTGGELIDDLGELVGRMQLYAERRGVRFRAPQLPIGRLGSLRIESRDGGAVPAPERVGVATPQVVAEMRARRALGGESTDAEVLVRSAIEFDVERISAEPSRLEARVDLFEVRQRLQDLDRSSFRVTIGVHLEDGELLTRHDEVHDVDVAGQDEWIYESSLRLPPETDGAVVLVELLETGDWGESFASFVRARDAVAGDAPASVEAVPEDLLPGRRVLRLEPPTRAVMTGRVPIRAQVDPRVQRVVYTLDGKRVATRRREPWGTTIDLGSNPRQSLLVAIAYDRDGSEVGRDGLVLNDAAQTFDVRITEPPPGKRIGPVDVEAEVTLPAEAVVDRVEFYWLDQLVSVVRRPPWRQRVLVPVASQPGFIRVVAHLADGRLSEDVVLMNADRFEELVSVNLLELYVVVTDRNGQPVRDLEEGDFEVLEEGVAQSLESFEVAGSLPITVGLALDSSLSLFLKMPEVQAAATDFVDSLMADRDRAFLVGFSSRPRVVQATTSNLGSIVSGIRSLDPGGTTALWEAVVLSLLQVQEASGRKALVVFYDGDDEDEDFSFGTSLKLAQRVGVPIYLIVMNNSAARTEGRSFATKNRANRLERIARAGGGKVFYVRTDEDLGGIFDAISEELRSHYLLTYYPEPREGEDPNDPAARWRPIEVRVKKPGLTARTLAGYEKL